MIDVQTGLDGNLDSIDQYTLPLLKNPAYKKRMSGVSRDFVRLDYFWVKVQFVLEAHTARLHFEI